MMVLRTSRCACVVPQPIFSLAESQLPGPVDDWSGEFEGDFRSCVDHPTVPEHRYREGYFHACSPGYDRMPVMPWGKPIRVFSHVKSSRLSTWSCLCCMLLTVMIRSHPRWCMMVMVMMMAGLTPAWRRAKRVI
jgi:hypothetical protein